ncbi:hypothetical protein DCAR_0728327 [Daucus carota subsp. sativus]|uniref:BAG domain-containing protein n=1 Tax=Daucus carota subsp. sativus TaxID=79200 RepID=A0A164TH44_DAUCS|nr:PREDICTED: uncharacterized protein LOC108194731 [Daucus carota subsp. sativus]WOH08876.1 hypothetical protein DCAR_0728327 [Daucus carota subsp. sativus]
MASPFYSGYWNHPNEPRYSPSSIPLKRKPETASPKVISIPVHFVDSKNNRVKTGLNRSDAALRIQKVFRGFLLRRSVDRIVKIKNEVEEIERRIAKKETVELIRKDSKERLRINETLMALLFKLDSVRGIDFGVRDLRKRVIKKAIALQEKVDALVELPSQSSHEENEAVVDKDDSPVCDEEMPIENPPAAISADIMPIENAPAAMSNDDMPIENHVMPIENPSAAISAEDMPIENDVMPIEVSPAAASVDNMPIENEEMPIEDVIDSMDQSQDFEEEGNCVVKEVIEDCNTMNSKTEMQMQMHDEEADDCSEGVQPQAEEDTGEVTMGDHEKTVIEEAGEKKSNEDLQSQMIRMMSELVEKNEQQTRMINSLTHRVGQLEKAFLCDKLRRSNKKKKRQHDAAADEKQP